jgi:hypothetical protein
VLRQHRHDVAEVVALRVIPQLGLSFGLPRLPDPISLYLISTYPPFHLLTC